MNTTLTQTQIREETLSRLGGSRVEIELDQKDLDLAVKEAVRVYSRHQPGTRWSSLNAAPAQKRYVLDVAEHPGIVGVLDVQFVTRRVDPSAVDVFDPYDNVVGGLLVGNESFGDITQRRIYMEDATRVVSAESEWRYTQEGSDHVLYVDVIRTPTLTSYVWAWHYTPDDDADTGMLKIPNADVDWILDYVEARSMLTLGRVRRKFGGIPNAEGGVDEIDGQTFVDEANTKLEQLREQIEQRRFIVPPVTE